MTVTPKEVQEMLSFFVIVPPMYACHFIIFFPPVYRKKDITTRNGEQTVCVCMYVCMYVCDLSAQYICT